MRRLVVLVGVLCILGLQPAWARLDSEAQYAALAAAIQADASLADEVLAHDFVTIAAAFNANNSPDFWVWRTSISKDEFKFKMSQDGTTFIFAGNGFIGRTVQELIGWQELFNTDGITNASLSKVRDGFIDVFSGTGNAANNRNHLLATARRKATRAERLYATGLGGTALADVGTMVWEGLLDVLDIAHCLYGAPLP